MQERKEGKEKKVVRERERKGGRERGECDTPPAIPGSASAGCCCTCMLVC